MPVFDLLRPSRYVPEATSRARLAECEKCPHRTRLKRCQFCGCFVYLKARLTTETCPLKKWEK